MGYALWIKALAIKPDIDTQMEGDTIPKNCPITCTMYTRTHTQAHSHGN